MDKDLIRKALEVGLENTTVAKEEHLSSLGGTTRKNKYIDDLYAEEIDTIRQALAELDRQEAGYLFADIADVEATAGFEVNEAFRHGFAMARWPKAMAELDRTEAEPRDFVSLVRAAGFGHCHCFVADNGNFVCQLKKGTFVRDVYFSPDLLTSSRFAAEMVKEQLEDAMAELDRTDNSRERQEGGAE
jgi:hypothetical protein